MVKKKRSRLIVALSSLVLCAVMLFTFAGTSAMKVFAAEASSDDNVKYLSDLDYSSVTGMAKRPPVKDAIDANGTKMQLKVEGAWYTFEKGMYTHGSDTTAILTLTYNLSNLDYKYFTAYVGLNKTATKGDGVKFKVETSVDGTNWTSREQTTAIGPQAEAKFLNVDISGAKSLRLSVDRISGNAHDHAAWADAKLVKSLDIGDGIGSLETYDAQIKAKVDKINLDDKQQNLFADKDLELLVLKREFVRRVGQFALKKFMTQSDEKNEANQAVLKWLLNDLDSLREFMLGGAPFKGNYYNSLSVLSDLYKSYKKDLDDKTPLNNKFMPNRTFGELCRTMMFSVALTHDGTIGSYLQAGYEQNQSKPNRRYAIYKYLYKTERFVATKNADGSWAYETMTLFGSLKVEEMRWIMSNIIDDESIIWLNDYVQTRINTTPKNVAGLHTPHSYVRYTDPNYNNPVFYDDENYQYFNELFAVDYKDDIAVDEDKIITTETGRKLVGMWDTKYIVPAGEGEEPYVMTISRKVDGIAKLQKVWMNFNNKFKTGSVCGGISKSGCNIRGARGIPVNVIGQPGHAAILYYSKDTNGNGNWKIDNDVGGWVAATKNERHLLGWGNETWHRNSGGGGTVVFFHLAQECLNDYDNFVKAEEYCWLAKVYQGDLDRQEKLYEKALTAQVKNLDAWYGLVRTYKAKTNKTANDFGNLANRIGTTLYNHPLAMHCLFRLFLTETGVAEEDNVLSSEATAVLSTPAFTTQLKTVELEALKKAQATGSTAAKSKVNLILGATDTAVADFSFDGENAGCIVWADTYSDGTFTWKYSVDGKKTWKEVTFEEGQSHAYQLPEEDLAQITTDNDIYVYIVGASPDNAYKIDVAARPTMPDTLYANDWENRVIGVDATYEWRYLTTDTEGNYTPTNGWISYAEASPDCSGNKAVEVRLKGTAKKPASESRIYTFTANNDTNERKYISVNYLSMVGFSTESQDAKRPNYALNAIDGNAKTYWHTDYTIDIKNSTQGQNKTPIPRVEPFLTIKLDVPRYISALEFAQTQYNTSFSIFAKNVTVYVSETGEDGSWKEAGKRENLENVEDLNAVHFTEPVYGQYVKLVMNDLYETNKNDGVFTTVSMINLYEDATKTTAPNGDVMQSLTDIAPSKDAFAGLGNIISEDEALIVGGEPTSDDSFIMDNPFSGETGAPRKSNAGLVVALVVVGCVLVLGAAATVFVLYKRKKAVAGGANNADKVSKPKASTPAPKASAPAPKASTPAPTASTTTPKPTATVKKPTATVTKVNPTKPINSTKPKSK